MRRHRIIDVAEQAGLSAATVDRVLHDRDGASPRAARAVERAVADLDRQAAALRLGARQLVLDVVMQAPDRFSGEVRTALEAQLTGLRPAAVRARFHLRESGAIPDVVATLDGIGRGGRTSDGVLLKAPEDPRIVDSTGALNLGKNVPARMVIVGAGAIGLEFADVYSSLGSAVTVVEMLPNIAGATDIDASKELRKALEKRDIRILTSTKVLSQKATKKGTEVTVQGDDGKQEVILADRVLVAVGRRPNGAGLGLDAAGVKVDERGFVPVVNDHMQTNVPHVYAIGDVACAPLLAHKAMKEGVVAAEHAAGQPSAYDTVVPSVIYTSPELASVGMTEEEAKAAGFEVRIGRFPLAASGRAATLGVDSGLIKLVGDAKTDLLLGFHMVGPNAGDIVAEATLAIEMGATLEDIALTQHPHPTISEGVMEAAEQALGKAIHIANRRR